MHPEAHERFMSKGGFLTPHKGVDKSKYASDTFRGLHDFLVLRLARSTQLLLDSL